MAPQGDDHVYHPVDALAAGSKGALITGSGGLFAAAVQNTMRKGNAGALGVFTKSGGTIVTWGTSHPIACHLARLQVLPLTSSPLAH